MLSPYVQTITLRIPLLDLIAPHAKDIGISLANFHLYHCALETAHPTDKHAFDDSNIFTITLTRITTAPNPPVGKPPR